MRFWDNISLNKLSLAQRWLLWSTCLTAFCLFLLLFLFYPGFMSEDTIDQLNQASGASVLNNWHPPLLSILWRGLIYLTGHISSLFMLNILLFVGALQLLSLYIFLETKSIKRSLLVYGIIFLPNVLNIVGVVWKDTVISSLGLLSIAILLLESKLRSNGQNFKSHLMLVISGALLLLAVQLRYNFLGAAAPLIFVLLLRVHDKFGKRVVGYYILGMVVLVTVMVGLTGFVAKNTHPTVAIQIDDIINVGFPNAAVITDSELDGVYKNIASRCKQSATKVNSFVVCASPSEQHIIRTKSQSVTKDWLYSITSNFPKYISYRISLFARFLFVSPSEMYIVQAGIANNNYGLTPKNSFSVDALMAYVIGFGKTNMPFLFQPWFWLTGSLVLALRLNYFNSKIRRYLQALCASAFIYILAYIPIVVSFDYRYGYWSVIATLAVFVILISARRQSRGKLI